MLILPFCFGCSCSSLTALTFNNAFYGYDDYKFETAPSPNYTEKLSYTVEYEEQSEYYNKDAYVDNYMTFEFTNGTYGTELKVLPSVPQEINTDITFSTQARIYELKTTFKINSSYKTKNGDFSNEDSITTVSYLCDASLGFAPLYSKTTSKYLKAVVSANSTCYLIESENEIFYNTEKYTIKEKILSHGVNDGKSLSDIEPTETDYEYGFKTVIDNSELLFAIRNTSLKENDSILIPTVLSSYGEYQTLTVKNASTSEHLVNLTINGESFNEKIKVNKVAYSINATKNSGMTQYLFVQNSASEHIPYKALPVQYVEPLIADGNDTTKLGTLIYTLKSVE